MSSPNEPSAACTVSSIFSALDCGNGVALQSNGYTIDSLLAAIAYSVLAFGVQLFLFLLLRLRFSRIYRPRSYLVPERERVPPPPTGLFAWLRPLFATPNLTFIQKCGLDAYFFLRYLRMLLHIFVPVAVVLLPILLPLNYYSGGNNAGLDKLSISNVGSQYVHNRLWAHLILAVLVIVYFGFVVYRELRGYIRVRQAFLTSPQHRIRASATTVLVSGIPRKWLTREALAGLYDVFPGGIKNIWINRNFDELQAKVDMRNDIAKSLESAETNLIKMCHEAHAKKVKEAAKKEGLKRSKTERKRVEAEEDAAAEGLAESSAGTSAGDQGNARQGLNDLLREEQEREAKKGEQKERWRRMANPLALVGGGLGAVGQGLGHFGKGVGALGQRVVGEVDGGLHKVGTGFDHALTATNQGGGFATDDELYRRSIAISDAALDSLLKSPAFPSSSELVDPSRQPSRTDAADLAGQTATHDWQDGNERGHSGSSKGEHSVRPAGTPESDRTLARPPSIRMTRPSVESKPKSNLQIEEPPEHQNRSSLWKFWKVNDHNLALPSPQPHTGDEDEFPLHADAPRPRDSHASAKREEAGGGSEGWMDKLMFWRKSNSDESSRPEEYPVAINPDLDEDKYGEPMWRRYIEPKQRDTMRLPLAGWMPALPLVGKKVDKIYHLRRELARLNVEIEMDQAEEEKYPFMNSAFIQFNHQVAAHMACQSVSHHVPQNMAPRLVEISPDDVIWDNMSVKWWERYIRTALVLAVCAAMIILYAIPVSFTSLLSKISYISRQYPWLHWLTTLPTVVQSIISGALPPILLNIILYLVPLIFRILVRQQGVASGTGVQLGVQAWYFSFLFIQVFFVVTLSGGLTTFFSTLASNPGKTVKSLADSLPKAADYFFYYLLVQGMSNSASALLQVVAWLGVLVLGPLLDSTPRAKWRRKTDLSNVTWGTFFPPFTNFAVIGLIYSVIAPFILVFMLIIFGLFWLVYRYNVLYVYQFRHDTGGLLFPTAVNQLFTGIYFLELCLIGYFFISTNPQGQVACIPQGAVMIVVLILTVLFQWQLNATFAPLLKYLPITLEDEAVIRDEEFARAQASRFAPMLPGQSEDKEHDEGPENGQDIQEVLANRERKEREADQEAEKQDRREQEAVRRHSVQTAGKGEDVEKTAATANSGADVQPTAARQTPSWNAAHRDRLRRHLTPAGQHQEEESRHHDLEAQKHSAPATAKVDGDILFSSFADELEDLSPTDRDLLVRRAFLHSALRAKRPIVWIPKDSLGVSDDEIRRAAWMSTVRVHGAGGEKGGKGKGTRTNISMSNVGAAVTGKGKVIFRRSPPDFNEGDLIAL
ncbi:hypothetical protein M433DRAFT_159674 [Acidomyces richmondensis BFW]|nr:hypothetical protein M433DRAFT_159674 [Acidomyces richmondensis BFW]